MSTELLSIEQVAERLGLLDDERQPRLGEEAREPAAVADSSTNPV